MVETGKGKRQAFGWANGFNQALAVFGWAVLIAISGNIGLAPLLIAIGLATIAKLALGGHRYPLWATPSFIFLPALFIFSRGLTTLTIGSPAWNFRMGGLFVTLWISGLAYILIATIVRYVGLQKMRRAFSPVFSGIIILLLALSLLPRIFQYAYYEPLLGGVPSYKLLIIGLAAFMGYLITTSLAKKPGAQAKFAVLIGLASGLAATILVDAVEVLFLSKDLASTLLIGRFDATLFQGVPLTVFHNMETSFGFFQYLHFDLELRDVYDASHPRA